MRGPGPGLRRAGLIVLILGGLSLAVLSLAGQWTQVRAGARDVSVGYLMLAALAVGLSLTFNLFSWRSLLSGLGVGLPLRPAARIYFVGQLGKYVPGSVWPVLAQMELGARYGLSRAAVGATSLLALAIALPVALLLGLLVVPALVDSRSPAYLLLFLALPLLVVLLVPGVLNPLLARALRLVKRDPLPRLDGQTLVVVAFYSVCTHLFLGLSTWLLARDLGATGWEALPLAIGGFCLASAAGLLAVPVPAGAGVREGVLVLALEPVLPVGQALLVALLSRALLTLGDVTAATVAARRTGQTGRETIFRDQSNL